MVVGLLGGAALAATTLTAPSGPVPAGGLVSLDFAEDQPGKVFIEGCASFELERNEGERWIPVPVRQCDRMVPATAVDGKITLSAPAPGAGEFRAAVTWGLGCREGLPLALAGCRALEVAWSEPFSVLAKP